MKYRKAILIFCFFILALTILLSDFFLIVFQDESSFSLTGSISNLAGTGVASLFFILITNETRLDNMIVIAILCALGLIIYEFLQIMLPWQVFDIKDIMATLMGMVLIIAIILFNHYILKRKLYKMGPVKKAAKRLTD